MPRNGIQNTSEKSYKLVQTFVTPSDKGKEYLSNKK